LTEKADLAQDLKISEVDDHNVCIGMYVICHKQVYFFNVMLCDKLALSWNSPCHPNGGRVDYFCFGVGYQDFEFNVTGYEIPGHCYTSLQIDQKVKNGNRSWVVGRVAVNNGKTSFSVKLPILKHPKSEESIRLLVQTASHMKWKKGRATQKSYYHYTPRVNNTDNNTWIAGVAVCSVVIFILIPLLICSIRYGRGKRKEAVNLQSQVYYLNSYSDFPITEAYQPDEWEVDAKCVVLHDVLGEGAFGKVYSGTLLDGKTELPVAIKTLKDEATPAERTVFLKESSMMKKLGSDNVVRLLGIVSKTDPVYVLMELMPNGDLKRYLQSIRPKGGRNEDGSYSSYPLVEDELVNMALQIAAGMHYLHSQRFIHRDLAARNCMVAANPKVIKIGDFGMTREVYSTDYYVKRGQG
jgi:hypothetical protein